MYIGTENFEWVTNIIIPVYDPLIELRTISEAMRGTDASIYCPCHDDTNHKSGKIYGESNSIFCFKEWKVYRPFHIYTKFLNYSYLDLYYKYQKLYDEVDPDTLSNPYETRGMYLEQLKSLGDGGDFWRGLEGLLFCEVGGGDLDS